MTGRLEGKVAVMLGNAAGGLERPPDNVFPDGPSSTHTLRTMMAVDFNSDGFTDIVTWKRVVPARPAALMLFVLHAALVVEHLEPAAAVARVRAWMRDQRRGRPHGLPDEYAATFARRDLADEAYWGALVHRNR